MNQRLDESANILYNQSAALRTDGQEGKKDAMFFTRELETVKKEVREKKYPNFKQRTLIPTTFNTDPGAETITYYLYDHVGIAKIGLDYANDSPRASTKKEKFTSNIEPFRAHYAYSTQDIRRSRMSNTPLEQREAMAGRKSIQLAEQKVAYFGDSAYNLEGLFSNSNITLTTVPSDGGTGQSEFTDKDPDQIVRDINNCINIVNTQTNGVEEANTVLLAPTEMTYIKTTRMGDGSDTTIYKFLKEAHEDKIEFFSLAQCAEPTAGWSSLGLSFSGNIMMAYKRDPEALELEVPQDFEQMEPEVRGMTLRVECHERCGGVIWYQPLAANISQGVG